MEIITLLDAMVEGVNWSQAWELLTKMASNYECVGTLLHGLVKHTKIGDSGGLGNNNSPGRGTGVELEPSISSSLTPSASLTALMAPTAPAVTPAQKQQLDTYLGALFHRILLVRTHSTYHSTVAFTINFMETISMKTTA